MEQIIRPTIPYRGPVPGGLQEGKQIKIKGHVPPYGVDRFTVNLLSGFDPQSDRPLHISVRFQGNVAVRNTLINNSYGSEERSGPFPFALGRDFTMVIRVNRAAYSISVNGQQCWNYSHRIPFSRVSSILIDGEVEIQRIEFIDNFPQQRPATPMSPSAPVYTSSLGFLTSPPPCTFPIHGGVRPGMNIYISGRPSDCPQKFTINLQNGTSSYPPPDIAFYFDVSFLNYSIVRNNRINNVWASEETMISHFPFQPRVNFDMIIVVQSNAYVITLNGKHFISFRHRSSDLSRFDTLYIEKDVIITSIRYT